MSQNEEIDQTTLPTSNKIGEEQKEEAFMPCFTSPRKKPSNKDQFHTTIPQLKFVPDNKALTTIRQTESDPIESLIDTHIQASDLLINKRKQKSVNWMNNKRHKSCKRFVIIGDRS